MLDKNKNANRSPYIDVIEVNFGLEVQKSGITLLMEDRTGKVRRDKFFNLYNYARLNTAIEQTAFCRALADKIEPALKKYFSTDPSGTKAELQRHWYYNETEDGSTAACVVMSYRAANGRFGMV